MTEKDRLGKYIKIRISIKNLIYENKKRSYC